MNRDWTNIMSNFLNDGENEIANEPPEDRYSMKRCISASGESARERQTSEALSQEYGRVNSSQDAKNVVLNRFEVDDHFGNDSVVNVVEHLDSLTVRWYVLHHLASHCQIQLNLRRK